MATKNGKHYEAHNTYALPNRAVNSNQMRSAYRKFCERKGIDWRLESLRSRRQIAMG